MRTGRCCSIALINSGMLTPCKKWMPLNIETTPCLRSGHKRCKKYDWRVVQFSIRLDSRCYFASIRVWHHDIKQD